MLGKIYNLLFLFIIFLNIPVYAMIRVPHDYPTIQEALDNASSGEMVVSAMRSFFGLRATLAANGLGGGGAQVASPIS